VNLVEILDAHPHRQRLQAELDEPATPVQVERGVVAGGDGQLDHFQFGMLLRLSQGRLHQLMAQAVLADIG
jgi:hypothetical protein